MISKHIGLGTATIGRPQYINIRTERNANHNLEVFRANGLAILETAYQQGIRYFDTAPGYGMAEDLLNEWLKTKNHQDLEIATKWGYKYVANFNPNAKVHEIKEHSLKLLNEQWKNSNSILSNISTLQIHSATFETGVLEDLEILERLNEIKKENNIRIGLSTTGANQVGVLNYALDVIIDREPLFETFQVTYNILDQSLATIAERFEGKRLVIKEALANGRLLSNA
ncbi:MAG: aldo/keto reductase, partial [Bacteroidota bacterium]